MGFNRKYKFHPTHLKDYFLDLAWLKIGANIVFGIIKSILLDDIEHVFDLLEMITQFPFGQYLHRCILINDHFSYIIPIT